MARVYLFDDSRAGLSISRSKTLIQILIKDSQNDKKQTQNGIAFKSEKWYDQLCLLTSYTSGFHGGWGGKFVRPDPQKNHWFDDPMGTRAVYKWRAEAQKDFERRADWMLP